jgi:hypothetical protein
MPIDRGVIDQQLQALGESPRWWEQREFLDLPAVLQADERMLAIARGKVARLRWLRRTWLIVVTDRRLVCLRSAGRSTWRQLEVNAGQITRVRLRIGPFHGRVIIEARSGKVRLLVSRLAGYRLSTALSTLSVPPREMVSGFRPARIARRVLDHVLALPAVALSPEMPGTPRPAPPALPPSPEATERIHALEDEIEELRQQVRFLEQLLHRQQAGADATRLLSG